MMKALVQTAMSGKSLKSNAQAAEEVYDDFYTASEEFGTSRCNGVPEGFSTTNYGAFCNEVTTVLGDTTYMSTKLQVGINFRVLRLSNYPSVE
jgi:hypothetical protein